MTVAEYIVNFLRERGVKDMYGVPGGVILDFLYAAHYIDGIEPHLCNHEQIAGFAAAGYAQVHHQLGVAYATRGPGITNMVTPLADAFFDSLPVLFFTAHGGNLPEKGMRCLCDQEFDIVALVRKITKFSARVDNINDVEKNIERAYAAALSGRKGPVLLDIAASLWKKDMPIIQPVSFVPKKADNYKKTLLQIREWLQQAQRPVLLIGDGINQSHTQKYVEQFISRNNMPVVSSRCSQDILSGHPSYFGYIGSHGIREANLILSKADLILSIGNRMAFPVNSTSYTKINAPVIRLDIDENEFNRSIPDSMPCKVDLENFMPFLGQIRISRSYEDWISICNKIRKVFINSDFNVIVKRIRKIIESADSTTCFIGDVGNNEFWLSKAYYMAGMKNRLLFSHSFGSLGAALPKAMGSCHSRCSKSFCFIGDQGLQFSLGALETIAHEHLPILIVVLNNHASGMILDRELRAGYQSSLHSTCSDGYSAPNYKALAKGFGMHYYVRAHKLYQLPAILEVKIPSIPLVPTLEKGKECGDMFPYIERKLYNELIKL